MLERIINILDASYELVRKRLPALIIAIIIVFPLFYYLIIFILFNYTPSLYEIIFLLLLLSLSSLLSILFSKLYTKKMKKDKDEIEDELRFYNLIIGNTNEIIILLNNLGEIINFNPALVKSLNIDGDILYGRPFRNLFSLIDTEENLNFKLLILEKLKEAFQGRVTEIISPIKVNSEDEFQSIYFKLTPNIKNNDLESIFVLGRLLQHDFITNNWLESETSNYAISNDLTLSNILCYRLTRNLDGKLPRNQILFIQIALQEVIINAIEHGNLEISYEKKTELKKKNENYFELLLRESNRDYIENRRVHIAYDLGKDLVTYVISDEGKGFNWKKYMGDEYSDTFADNLMETFHGVGLQMVKSAFDTIQFNREGNKITLIKYFSQDGVPHEK